MKKQTKKQLRIGFIHNAFPVLSETFISKEMIGLAERGLDIRIYSLFYPEKNRLNPDFAFKDFTVWYLRPAINIFSMLGSHLAMLFFTGGRYVKTAFFAVKNRSSRYSIFKTVADFLFGKELSKSQRQDMLLHFLLAMPLARKMRKDRVTFVNSHFADAAASFALLTSRVLNIPYAVTAHAYDVFTPQTNLAEKLKYACFILTCTYFNKSTFVDNFTDVERYKIHVFYHGIDTTRFQRKEKTKTENFEILSVGRLVPKKGFPTLIQSCAQLKAKGFSFRCRIVGGGPQRERLERLIIQNHLQDCVELVGTVPPNQIFSFYEKADLFVLPCEVEENGNRDGIPNVLAEAMAMNVPVISTPVSGIPELVEHDRSGVLVNSRHPDQLAEAIEKLINDKKRRQLFAGKGRKRVVDVFDSEKCLNRLAEFYKKAVKTC